MSPTDYVVGVVAFTVMLAGCLGGAWLLLRKRYGHLTGAPKAVAYGILVTLGVLAVHLVPLILTVADRITVLVATAVWVGAAAVTPRVAAEPEPNPEPDAADGTVARVLAAVALMALAFIAAVVVRDRLTIAPMGIDLLNFHMPSVGAWLQTGSLWHIDVYLPDVAPGHYPNNGDVLTMATVLPWKSDFLAPMLMVPYWVLSGVAVYALLAELRVPRATAAMTAAVAMAIPVVLIPGLRGDMVDTVMVFGFVAGLLFLVRHDRTGRTCELVLAGLSLGLSFGTKWYAVSTVPAVVAVWTVARGWGRRRWAELVRQSAAVTGLVALSGGIWMVRNLVESGNPAFPVKVSLFGATIFDAPFDRARALGGFTIADYAFAPDVWRTYILPQFRDAIAGPAALAMAGLVVAVVLLVARRRQRDRATAIVAAGVVLAVILGLAYVVTPYTAGGLEDMPTLVAGDARYAVPALVVAAMLAGWAAARVRHGPAVFAVAGLLTVLDGIVQFSQAIRLEVRPETVAFGVLAVAAGPAVVLSVRALRERATLRRQALVFGGAAVVLAAVLVAGGRKVQQDYVAKRYLGRDAVADALNTQARTGKRVGLSGVWADDGLAPPLLAYGPRFGNHVAYIGYNDKDMLRRYRSRSAFAAAVDRAGYDFIVVGRGRPPKPSVNEERWAVAAGYRPVARSERLSLFRR